MSDIGLMTLDDVAVELRVSRRTVERQVERYTSTRGAAGLGPLYRIGRRLRLSRDSVESYIQASRVPAVR